MNFSPDDQLLLYSCGGGVGTYDLRTDRHTVFLRDDYVNSAAMSSDGQVLAAPALFSGKSGIWGMAGDREIGVRRYDLSPTGTRSYGFRQRRSLLITAFGRTMNLWNLTGPDERIGSSRTRPWSPNVAFNWQGRSRLRGPRRHSQTMGPFQPRLWRCRRYLAFDDYVQTVAFSRDGLLLATGDWSGDIWICDPHTGEKLTRL